MANFYETQLALLTGFCIFYLLLERYASKQKRSLPKNQDPDYVEKGHSHKRSSSVSGASGLAQLTRKYLVVYGIVMSEWLFASYWPLTDSSRVRCRLATRSLCLLPLQRTVWLPRENCCYPLRHWVRVRWVDGTPRWRLGRPTVCPTFGNYVIQRYLNLSFSVVVGGYV